MHHSLLAHKEARSLIYAIGDKFADGSIDCCLDGETWILKKIPSINSRPGHIVFLFHAEEGQIIHEIPLSKCRGADTDDYRRLLCLCPGAVSYSVTVSCGRLKITIMSITEFEFPI